MKILLLAFVLTLAGCASHNPLAGQVTTITPSATDENMVEIQATIKRIVNEQGIQDAYLYWIINDAQKKDNMAVYDITITVKGLRQRFLFGLTDHKVDMVKEIEVDAEVNCQHEGEQYEGRDQA
jgi:ABC-type Fe3+-hydroxamate transport system substrate-binding protein